MARKIIYGHLLLIFILLLLSYNNRQEKYFKLLLYATINDSLKIVRSDTNWLKNAVCIQLKIDTVYTPAIKEFKKEKNFYYNGKIFNKEQLFNMTQLKYISKFKIISLAITCTGAAFEPPVIRNNYYRKSPEQIDNNYNCTSPEQMDYLKTYWITSRMFPNETFKVYFETEAINTIDNKKIELNTIIWIIK